jgi:hypothetical protein
VAPICSEAAGAHIMDRSTPRLQIGELVDSSPAKCFFAIIRVRKIHSSSLSGIILPGLWGLPQLVTLLLIVADSLVLRRSVQ